MRFSRLNRTSKPKLNLSLKNRFWLFQIVVVLIILSGIFIVASLSGVIADLAENHTMTLSVTWHISSLSCLKMPDDIQQHCELAEKVNNSIKKQLQEKGIKRADLKKHPELLEETLSAEVEKACFIMEAGVTGVFVFSMPRSALSERSNESKAGFYVVDMNRDPVPYVNQQLFLLYGPVNLARDNNIHLHTQWELELNISRISQSEGGDMFEAI